MLVSLTVQQCRVIGVMLEKEITTPDQYPLSLNGLTVGCNQKSNRDPVMCLSEIDVQNIIDELKQKRLINEQTGFGSRVVKYKHRFCNTEFGDLQLSQQQLAVICVLLLRGPQTPGELRTRTNRLAEFEDVAEVETTLAQLQQHNNEQLVKKLPKEPGKRESRYQHLFTNSTETSAQQMDVTDEQPTDQNDPARIDRLEAEIAILKQKVAQLEDAIER